MASRATQECAECGEEMSWMELTCPNEDCVAHFYCRECGGPIIRSVSARSPIASKCEACGPKDRCTDSATIKEEAK